VSLRYVLMQDPDPDDFGFILGDIAVSAELTTFRFTETARRIKDRLLKLAYKLEQSSWTIFDDIVSDGILALDTVPNYPVKYAITLSEITDHTKCTGTVTIDEEDLTFSGENRLVTERVYPTAPVIVTVDLDCNAKIECVTEFGEIIEIDSLTPIMILWYPKTRILRDPSGSGAMQTDYDVFTTNSSLKIGDQILLSDPFQDDVNHSIYIRNESAGVDLGDNSMHFRLLNCA